MAVLNQIVKNGGIDPSYYSRVASAESGGNSNAKNPNSSASGTFQFIKSTWNAVVDKYGLGYSENDRFDKYKSKEVAELFTRDNSEQLKKYGINPNNTDLYAAHFMGVGGAHKLLSAQRQDPNQSVYSVATTAQINANKNIFLHKNGTPKTVGQVYQILGDKINKTHNYSTNYKQINEYKDRTDVNITPNLTTLAVPTINSNFTEVSPQSKEQEQQDEEDIAQATAELYQKQNEEDFFNNYLNTQQTPQKTEEYEPVYEQVQQQNPYDVTTPYAQTEQFIEMQKGGFIQDNRGQWAHPGKLTEINSPNITMQGVNYDVLGISKETGERKLMKPNQNYHFKNTENVLEIPQLQKYFR